MHGAAYGQFLRAVKYLDAHGAKIEVWNQVNKHGWTPLRIAEGHRSGALDLRIGRVAAVGGIGRRASPEAG